MVNTDYQKFHSSLRMLLHYLVKLMSEIQAINDKLQGSVATYLKYGGGVNNQIKTCLLLSLSVNFFCKSENIWQSYKQTGGCLVHFVPLTVVTLPNIQSLKISLTDSAMSLINNPPTF